MTWRKRLYSGLCIITSSMVAALPCLADATNAAPTADSGRVQATADTASATVDTRSATTASADTASATADATTASADADAATADAVVTIAAATNSAAVNAPAPASMAGQNAPSAGDTDPANAAPRALAASDAPQTFESGANQEKFPKQILKTGVNLEARNISANSRQLAEQLHLLPLLQRIQSLRGRGIDPTNFAATTENIAASQQLTASTVMAMQIIDEANLSIDFVIAEINAEQNIYNEILGTFTSDRDKTVFKTNAVSFITNGILWAVAEGLDIPTNKHPNYSISSGTFGILAGIVPSIASIIALYQLNGKKELSEKDPNMLSKLLGYPANDNIEYPQPVWDFLTVTPASDDIKKTRKDQLIDRWISDKNMPNFTDRASTKQLDIVTASNPRKKGLTINTLNARQQMLQQLSAEILKMKRLLYELAMAVRGAKQV